MKPNTTPCPSLTTVLTLPGRVDSALLAKHRRADEPLIVVKLVGVGNTAPYDFHDKGTRSYIFRFESLLEGHILRVPLHLWQAGKGRLAHDLMDQRRLPHALVVTLDPPPAAKPTPLMNVTEMGATDTRTDTRNVVGPGAEPTVAPSYALRATEGRPALGDLVASDEAAGADASTVNVAATNVQAEAPPLIGGRPLHEAAYDLVEPPKRLKALAALLGVAEAALREAIAHADSRIELANAGWVRRKA
ncbi:MAG: hypothetical protein K9N47_25070 [Prosthecobacter sp.]|uniref:hypothetical protein n=1 Tax=Prosthecobacter sp. TaxID=1965333 RepID=UPI0026045F8A|nr:hypothetical protein [Prosthecobacter sp.]MCF7789418.1 hypothetical protein [Prosthecobacter sp.]